MGPTLRLYFLATVLLMILLSLLASFIYYRKYYLRMKTAHAAEWTALMNRDPAVAFLGEWIRWPFGSTYLLATLFAPDDYGDVRLRTLKKRALVAMGLFLYSLLFFFLLVSIGLPE